MKLINIQCGQFSIEVSFWTRLLFKKRGLRMHKNVIKKYKFVTMTTSDIIPIDDVTGRVSEKSLIFKIKVEFNTQPLVQLKKITSNIWVLFSSDAVDILSTLVLTLLSQLETMEQILRRQKIKTRQKNVAESRNKRHFFRFLGVNKKNVISFILK